MVTQGLISILFEQVKPFHTTGGLYSIWNYYWTKRQRCFW